MTVVALLATVAFAGDPSTPHPHRLLPAITKKPAALKLTASEKATVERNEPIVRSQRNDDGGSGQAVQYINAPADVVWNVILDYPKYPARVDSVVSCQVYRRQGDRLFVDMKSSIMGFKTVIYSNNDLHREDGWMAWTLDYGRTSDVKDLTGYWRVEQIRDSPPLTRVDHASNLAMTGVPGFVVSYLTKQSLIDGTAWVKETSEKLAR